MSDNFEKENQEENSTNEEMTNEDLAKDTTAETYPIIDSEEKTEAASETSSEKTTSEAETKAVPETEKKSDIVEIKDVVNPENKKKKKHIIVLPIILVLMVCGIAGYLFFLRGDKANNSSRYMKDAQKFMDEANYNKAISAYNMEINENPLNMEAYTGCSKAYELLENEVGKMDLLRKGMTVINNQRTDSAECPAKAADVIYAYMSNMVDDNDLISASRLLNEYSGYVADLKENCPYSQVVENDYSAVEKDGLLYFGEYPQKIVTDKFLLEYLDKAECSDNGDLVVFGCRYLKEEKDGVITYFKYEPIAWRMINDDNGSKLLISEYALDCIKYNEDNKQIGYGKCSIRKWLNDDFFNTAFNDSEKNFIVKTHIEPSKNVVYGNVSGAELDDDVTMLALEDITLGNNGFEGDYIAENADRICLATEYSEFKGVFVDMNGTCKYWIRTCGVDNKRASVVNHNGIVDCSGYEVDYEVIGVRPMITIN